MSVATIEKPPASHVTLLQPLIRPRNAGLLDHVLLVAPGRQYCLYGLHEAETITPDPANVIGKGNGALFGLCPSCRAMAKGDKIPLAPLSGPAPKSVMAPAGSVYYRIRYAVEDGRWGYLVERVMPPDTSPEPPAATGNPEYNHSAAWLARGWSLVSLREAAYAAARQFGVHNPLGTSSRGGISLIGSKGGRRQDGEDRETT